MFRFHPAGAQACEWVCFPVLHRVGGFAQCTGEVGAGEVPVRELARCVLRDVKRVHEDAAEMVKFGLIQRTVCGGLLIRHELNMNPVRPEPRRRAVLRQAQHERSRGKPGRIDSLPVFGYAY